MKHALHRSMSGRGLALALLAAAVAACGSADKTSAPTLPVFGTVAPLTAADVNLILRRAFLSIDTPDLHVAVVDRTGEILGVSSSAATITDGANLAISLARTTAYFSNSQAPLSSRTVETLGAFHFPPTFSEPFVPSARPVSTGGVAADRDSVIAPTRTTTGIVGTPQGPLWQINATNRGAAIATALTAPPTAFNAGNEVRPSRNLQGNTVFPAAPGGTTSTSTPRTGPPRWSASWPWAPAASRGGTRPARTTSSSPTRTGTPSVSSRPERDGSGRRA